MLTSKIEKTTPDFNYPVLLQRPCDGIVVLFNKETEGTIVHSNNTKEIGFMSRSWLMTDNWVEVHSVTISKS